MNESIERGDRVEKYIETAIRTNEDFLLELENVSTLPELKSVLHELAFVDSKGESLLAEVITNPNSEEVDVKTYSEEDVVRAVNVFVEDPVTELDGLEQEVRNWIEHRPIGDAVIRIISKELNEKTA